MKLYLEINNLTRSRLNRRIFRQAVLGALQKYGSDFLSEKKINVSLAVVKPAEIKKLNLRYRKMNKATDILSFSEYKNTSALRKERKKEIFLGELIICPAEIKEYSQRAKVSYNCRLAEVLAHGTLHLLGLDHGREMMKIQKAVSIFPYTDR